jgi:hypothetical protein
MQRSILQHLAARSLPKPEVLSWFVPQNTYRQTDGEMLPLAMHIQTAAYGPPRYSVTYSGSPVSTVTRLRAGRSGFHFRQGLGVFLLATTSRPALGPPSFLSSGYRTSSPGDKGGRCVKLTTHLHLMRKLRMSGAITSTFPHVFRDNFSSLLSLVH